MSFFSNLFNKRRNEMRKVAEVLDMDYYENGKYGLIDYLADFKLFSKGYSKSIKNLLIHVEGVNGKDVRIFDYKFVTGAGKTTQLHNQTVFYIHSPELSLPQFLLKPEHFFHKVGFFLGQKEDINFEFFPELGFRYAYSLFRTLLVINAFVMVIYFKMKKWL